MKIAICDDEQNQIQLTANYINQWAELNDVSVEIHTFTSAEAFLFQWSSSVVLDMVFLDIHMGQMSGIDLAERIRRMDEHLAIVFITGLKEYVFRGYDVNALHYLLKPIKEKDCFRCLTLANNKVKKHKTDTFLIPVDGQLRKFFYEEIEYFEVFSHYVEAHTIKGTFKYKKRISDLEKELPPTHFIRCHRSCIVNLMYINAIERTELELDDGTNITISKERWRLTNEAFLKYHLKTS